MKRVSSSDPWRYTVNCDWCGLPAFGKCKEGWLLENKYACDGHVDLLLIAGGYGGPLPEMDETTQIMQEALNPDGL